MKNDSPRPSSRLPLLLAVAALVPLIPLLVWDARPGLFPANAHDVLGTLPLLLVGLIYLIHQAIRRVSLVDMVRAVILAVAFFFWAANQLWPLSAQATLWNDLAIALFVLDVALTIFGWPEQETCDCTENGAESSQNLLSADFCGD